jgi:hypothetical protein
MFEVGGSFQLQKRRYVLQAQKLPVKTKFVVARDLIYIIL